MMLNSKDTLKYTKDLSILFVEDHEELRNNTSEILRNFFDTIDCAKDGEDAIEQYKNYYKENSKYYDIVLSDIQMPNIDGVELTSTLYNLNPSQLVIILSAFDDSKYLMPLINLGIEQFIEKPIDYQELLRTLLNSAKKIQNNTTTLATTNQSNKISFGNNVVFDKDNSLLTENNNIVYLTKYEIIFIQLLTQKIGKIYSNEDIANQYELQNETLDVQNIRKLVSKLRKKLPENSLESIYGIGYRIIPYVEI